MALELEEKITIFQENCYLLEKWKASIDED